MEVRLCEVRLFACARVTLLLPVSRLHRQHLSIKVLLKTFLHTTCQPSLSGAISVRGETNRLRLYP